MGAFLTTSLIFFLSPLRSDTFHLPVLYIRLATQCFNTHTRSTQCAQTEFDTLQISEEMKTLGAGTLRWTSAATV